MITRARDALLRGEFLQEFCPVPQELKDTVSGCVGGDEKAAHEAQMARNIELYGYKDWYDYCVAEWGTKWDVGCEGSTDVHPDGKMLHTYFDSAWSPPIGAYEKLEALGFGVNAMYYEGGMNYAGVYSDGGDEELNLEGMGADEIEQNYPELDEAFGISESIREYLSQEQEELTEWIKDGIEENKKIGLIAE
jgi:hypothetical protein